MSQGLLGKQMLVLTLLLALCPASGLPSNFTSKQEALDYCNQYEDLYAAIHEDLSPWRQAGGIDQDLMRMAVMQFTVLGRQQRGVQLGFSGGKAYVIVGNLTNAPVGWIGHHAHIFFTYMQVMLELEELFGDAIPDVEFVIASGDKPMVLKQERALSLYRDKIPGVITQTSKIVTTHAVTSSTVTTIRTKVTSIATRLLRSIGSRRRMLSGLFRDGAAEQQQQQSDSQESRQLDAGTDTQRALQQVSQQDGGQTLASDLQQEQQDAHQQDVTRMVSQQDEQMVVQQDDMAGPHQTAGLGRQEHKERLWRQAGAGQAAGRARMDSEKQQRVLTAQRKSGDMLSGHSMHRKKVNMDLPPPSLGVPVPVFRFCSSPGHADIRQPNFHFYTKKYNQRFLAKIPNITATFAWEGRKEVLFGRFSRYFRLIHPNVSETYRWGANGTEICIQETRDSSSCRVRQHFFDLSAQSGGLMDVHSKPKIPMSAHPQYKYLVHLDGQGLSSRLDQLLPLGSLVFKEESGYTTYYHHLLKPYVHYVPFWEKDPLEALERLAWAKANDDKARGIAEAGQQFAIRYLSKRARTCYWFKLISEFSKLLTYKPASGAGAMNETWVPIEEYFRTVAMTYEGGARFTPGIEQ